MAGETPIIFCYAPQRRAVMHMLEDTLGLRIFTSRIVGVDEREEHRMKGVREGVFVHILTVENPGPMAVPQRIWDALRIMGFTVVTLDDSNKRAKYGVRYHQHMTVNLPRDQHPDTHVRGFLASDDHP